MLNTKTNFLNPAYLIYISPSNIAKCQTAFFHLDIVSKTFFMGKKTLEILLQHMVYRGQVSYMHGNQF